MPINFKQIAMSIFSRKQEVILENFCRDFYDTQILNPVVGGVDVSSVLSNVVIKQIVEVNPTLTSIDKQKLADQLVIMRFELFALAWTHKFISGEKVVAQSAFTKKYLHEKGRCDIWNGMGPYNNMIDNATMQWQMSLGKMNLSFNRDMKESLTAENIEAAKRLNIEIDDSIVRVNHRLWSENAWKQKFILTAIQEVFYKNLNFNPYILNDEALSRVAIIIKGLYDGAQQSWGKVKIKN